MEILKIIAHLIATDRHWRIRISQQQDIFKRNRK